MRFLLSTTIFWILSPLAAFASEEGGHHALPLYADRVFGDLPITNSMLMVWAAALLVVLFSMVATRRMALIPAGVQNLAEWLVESLYDFLEGILGAHLVKRTFWFFGGVFILILFIQKFVNHTINWIRIVSKSLC